QLWPVAAHAEYRLALESPGRWAATMLVEGAGRFAPGPLPEVAASTHEWADLAPHAPYGPPSVLAAHERVVRGEDLIGATLPGPRPPGPRGCRPCRSGSPRGNPTTSSRTTDPTAWTFPARRCRRWSR